MLEEGFAGELAEARRGVQVAAAATTQKMKATPAVEALLPLPVHVEASAVALDAGDMVLDRLEQEDGALLDFLETSVE